MIKAYCGLVFCYSEEVKMYYIANTYTRKVCTYGSYEKCNEYFEAYIKKVSEKGG